MQLRLSDDLRSRIDHCQSICVDLRQKLENRVDLDHHNQGSKELTGHVGPEVKDTAGGNLPPGSFFSHAQNFSIENSHLYAIGGNLNQTVIGASGMDITSSEL